MNQSAVVVLVDLPLYNPVHRSTGPPVWGRQWVTTGNTMEFLRLFVAVALLFSFGCRKEDTDPRHRPSATTAAPVIAPLQLTIAGGVWITKPDGSSFVLRGLQISLILGFSPQPEYIVGGAHEGRSNTRKLEDELARHVTTVASHNVAVAHRVKVAILHDGDYEVSGRECRRIRALLAYRKGDIQSIATPAEQAWRGRAELDVFPPTSFGLVVQGMGVATIDVEGKYTLKGRR